MKTLLLCGYRDVDSTETALGLKRNSDGETLIDQRIREVRALGFDPVCVLAGHQADEQLRQCRKIQDTELVFDTNSPVTILSNTRSGVFAAPNEAVFVIPLEVEPPPRAVWDFLHNEYGKAGFAIAEAFLQVVDRAQGAPYHYGFPLLLTREGGKLMQNTPDLKGMADARLKYLQLVYSAQADLAPAPNPL